MKNTGKTNVMRVLDSLKIPYVSHFYEEDASLSGVEVARLPKDVLLECEVIAEL